MRRVFSKRPDFGIRGDRIGKHGRLLRVFPCVLLNCTDCSSISRIKSICRSLKALWVIFFLGPELRSRHYLLQDLQLENYNLKQYSNLQRTPSFNVSDAWGLMRSGLFAESSWFPGTGSLFIF